jgi:hypothetical protein
MLLRNTIFDLVTENHSDNLIYSQDSKTRIKCIFWILFFTVLEENYEGASSSVETLIRPWVMFNKLNRLKE